MLGWLREASTSASRWKRAMRSGSRAKASGNTFSATSRFRICMYCKVLYPLIEATGAGRGAVGQASRAAIFLVCAAMFQQNVLLADTVPVRHTEGLMHGFLVVRTLEGMAIADGQLT